MLLSISLVGVGGIVFPLAASAPADAASALQCVTPYLYATTDSGVYQINTQTGASSGPLSTSVGNQLGITPGGGTAIWTSGGRIIKYDAATGTTTSIPQLTAAGVGAVAGGVNPVNGLFYYGGFGPTLGKFTVFVYNPATNTTVGPVATITLPSGASNGNGDIAFDSMGRAYVLVSGPPSTLVRIDQPLPTTTPSQSLTSTTVVSISGASTGPFGGYAFGADGYLYASHGSTLYKVDPNTGVVTAAPAISGPAGGSPISDLGTCAVPNTIQVQKNLPNGRAVATDQFGLAVTGNGLSVGNTGTTAGSQTGIQNQSPGEIAGPVLGIAGRTYSITETAGGGTNLSSYATTWSCVNLAAGSAVVASGSGLNGSFVLPSGGADIVCTFSNVPLVPKIAVSKASTTTSISTVGQQVPFTFLVTNTGNVPLSNVSVTDVESAPAVQGNLSPVTCPSTTLAPGATETCTATYTVTQADLDHGQISDTATATGTPPSGPPVTSPPSTVTIPGAQSPLVSMVKGVSKVSDVNGNGITDAGDQIFYNFTVTNNGDVTLTNASIAEGSFTGSGALSALSCNPAQPATLAPGAKLTCTATYVVTQADVDAGKVTNAATATGTPPSGPPVSSTATATVPGTQSPAVKVVKRVSRIADVNGNKITDAGDRIFYDFTVTNTGDVTLSNVAVNDPLLRAHSIAVNCPSLSLAPGASEVCTAAAGYVISQADVDAGGVTNTATAIGTPPSGPPVTSPPSTATTPTADKPAITLVKRFIHGVDVNHDGVVDAGDELWWTFLVTNTGDVTVHGLQIQDPVLATQGIGVRCNPSTLAPGQSVTCVQVKPYIVTATDQARRFVKNVAIGTAFGPHGVVVPSNHSGVVTPLGQPPTSIGHIALPNMGGPPMAALLAGLLAIFGGLFLIVGSRRRRE